MLVFRSLYVFLAVLGSCGAWIQASNKGSRQATSMSISPFSQTQIKGAVGKKALSTTVVALGFFGFGSSGLVGPPPAMAKTELPSLEKCFNAVRKELDPKLGGESLTRLQKDIDTEDWTDMKKFTREYDAGFRGGVLKSVWKQLEGAQVGDTNS